MTENSVPSKKPTSSLTVLILLGIVILAAIAVFLSLINSDFGKTFLSGDTLAHYAAGGLVYEIIFNILTIAADVLYILGGGVIAFGAVLVTVRFVQSKLQDPYKLSSVSRYLSGYLSLGLEFFIGAEIIKTVAVRTYDEFTLLILVILSRGLFSLILYLDRRWHGTAETE
jgi:uncharacterized membrane protein